MNRTFVVCALGVVLAACGGGGGASGDDGSGGHDGGGGDDDNYPEAVKLSGTIEYARRTYDHPGGSVVIEHKQMGSFSGMSSSSALGGELQYSFDQPFTVTGTQMNTDVTNTPHDCSKTISGSTGSQLELYAGSPANGKWVAQLMGDIRTTADGTCANGGNVDNIFTMDVPNDDCPDPAIQVIGTGKWLVASGDPHTGFDFAQDITCDSTTVKISVSVEGL